MLIALNRFIEKGLILLIFKFFIVQRILPLVFAFSINTAPVLAWGEGGCSFSKNKEIKEVTTEQVENSNSSNK